MKAFSGKIHYGWIIVAITFLALMVSSGIRTAPSVLFKPLEAQFQWTRTDISLAVMISLFAFGLGAPLGGSLVDRLGPKRIMLLGLAMDATGLFFLQYINQLWQFHILWGLLIAGGTGRVANVPGATVALRWFNQHRGLVVGIFGAASAAVQTVFLPALIQIAAVYDWRAVILTLAICAGGVLIPVFILMRNQPQDIGLEPVGEA